MCAGAQAYEGGMQAWMHMTCANAGMEEHRHRYISTCERADDRVLVAMSALKPACTQPCCNACKPAQCTHHPTCSSFPTLSTSHSTRCRFWWVGSCTRNANSCPPQRGSRVLWIALLCNSAPSRTLSLHMHMTADGQSLFLCTLGQSGNGHACAHKSTHAHTHEHSHIHTPSSLVLSGKAPAPPLSPTLHACSKAPRVWFSLVSLILPTNPISNPFPQH